jgi:hypothetical protein
VPIEAGMTTIAANFAEPLTNGTNIESSSSYRITRGEILSSPFGNSSCATSRACLVEMK